eukprot:gnl/MRDRNA2_/MRDRNA2_138656_c0_seq1.p1 gnl/MRDRNA2_/MRDRNA2_138656_c0~~gnl/MRDRNA2_/MRDRNA2_138656_c0_seq1.p1  ORF type:complete len:394 (+),score=80.90 gnl/MRDRNA2_/MRDRNA2_138656_c0_seq1:64-1245(+)
MPPKKKPATGYGSSSKSSDTGSAYRFKVGTLVLCRTGPDEWLLGKIIRHNYSEVSWPPGRTVPYQVQLEDDRLIFVPRDIPEMCRKYEPPWWVSLFSKPGSHFATNPPAEELCKAGTGEDVNEKDHRGHTALLEAVLFRWLHGVSSLVSMKADVNSATKEMVHPLHMATRHGAELMQIILEARADPNCQDHDPDYDPNFSSVSFANRIEHRTPLHHIAADNVDGFETMISVLMQAKANPEIHDAHGKTPLHLAIEEDNKSIIELLLLAKADVNARSVRSKMETPLMHAAHDGNSDLAQQLILARADVNHQGKQGMSALHMAARRGNAKVVEILMSGKADVAQKCDFGTALELAKKNGGVELLKMFGVNEAPGTSNITSIASMDAEMRAALCLE